LHSAPDLTTGCLAADLDYDGTSYWRDWPDSTRPGMFPSPLLISPPSTTGGVAYPQMQFLTDNPATNSECSPSSTAACAVPPPQAPGGFYPYWTFASGRHGSGCAWERLAVPAGGRQGRVRGYVTQERWLVVPRRRR
jgi:hypothetical protein